jgi:hypothetical protein
MAAEAFVDDEGNTVSDGRLRRGAAAALVAHVTSKWLGVVYNSYTGRRPESYAVHANRMRAGDVSRRIALRGPYMNARGSTGNSKRAPIVQSRTHRPDLVERARSSFQVPANAAA